MTTLSNEGFPERVDVSGTKGCAMLVGDHLAHFHTQEPFEAGATEEATGGDTGAGKVQRPGGTVR